MIQVVFGIFMLVVIIILWQLLVKGWLWKLLLGIAGWFGIWIFLEMYFPGTKSVAINDIGASWSQVIPTIVVLMAMAYTKEE